jgi:hypothetical protein
MAKFTHLNASCHASVTRELRSKYLETFGRWNRTIHTAAALGMSASVAHAQQPVDPLPAILMQAAHKAKHCKCGSLKCPTCGFVKLHQRVARIEKQSSLTGYLTGGRLNF